MGAVSFAGRAPLLSVAGMLALGLAVGLASGADHIGPWPYIGRGAVAGTILFGVCGAAAAARLTPAPLLPVWPLLALPAGAVLSSLTLTVFGFAAVPLKVSLWLTLALGIAAWWRFARGRMPRVELRVLVPWAVAGLLVFLIATIPAWRLNETTVFGENPDAHQVVGSAVLFQNAPAWATRPGLPVNVVPSAWRFRYPILYALAGTSNLAKFDPVFVFPAMSGLLVMLAALGFGALVVLWLKVPLAGAPWVALAIPLSALTLHIAWHPYYNQLWGLALLPWTLAFGWWAVRERSRPAGVAFGGGLLLLGLAYPVAVLYPVLLVAGLWWAHRLGRPRIPRPRGRLAWTATVVVGLALFGPLLGAGYKLYEGVRQLLDLRADLWGGDIFEFTPLNAFVGTELGVFGLLAVLAVAAVAVARTVARREALALLALLGVSVLFAVRLRISDRGQYMDFKHLGYVGALVLALAAGGLVLALVSRRRVLMAGAAALAVAWTVPAVLNVRDVAEATPEQVTADMLRLREWARALPAGASIRVDIPPSGNQLWAQYFLAGKRLGSPYPTAGATYAYMPFSVAGDYVLHPRVLPGGETDPWPQPRHSTGVVRESYSFVLRRLDMPYEERLDRSSTTMVQP